MIHLSALPSSSLALGPLSTPNPPPRDVIAGIVPRHSTYRTVPLIERHVFINLITRKYAISVTMPIASAMVHKSLTIDNQSADLFSSIDRLPQIFFYS